MIKNPSYTGIIPSFLEVIFLVICFSFYDAYQVYRFIVYASGMNKIK